MPPKYKRQIKFCGYYRNEADTDWIHCCSAFKLSGVKKIMETKVGRKIMISRQTITEVKLLEYENRKEQTQDVIGRSPEIQISPSSGQL